MKQDKSGSHFAGNPGSGDGRRIPKPVLALLVIAAILAVVYLGGVAFFSFFFMPMTTLDGSDVSLKSASAVGQDLARSKTSGWTQTVSGDGLDLRYGASEVKLSYDGDAAALDAARRQGPWGWPVELASSRSLEIQDDTPYVSFDRAALSAIVDKALPSQADGAEAAGFHYNEEKRQFQLADDVQASYVNRDALLSLLGEKIRALDTQVSLGKSVLDMNDGKTVFDALDQANALVSRSIPLTLAGSTVVTVDASLIHRWVNVGKDLSVSLNRDEVDRWAKGELAEMADSYRKPRNYTWPDGTRQSVTASTGAYGWRIDGEAAGEELCNALEAGSGQPLEIPCDQSADRYNPGGQDWPNRYIDVNISTQHAVFFDENGSVIWEADVVTGQPNRNYNTTQGVWTITNKEHPSTLIGPEEDGEPAWVTHVDYWMGVVGNLMGFHNAPWRSAFGGDIYLQNGSHGCINLSLEKSAELYDLCRIGDVVIIHE